MIGPKETMILKDRLRLLRDQEIDQRGADIIDAVEQKVMAERKEQAAQKAQKQQESGGAKGVRIWS